jgi:hypothetical protein
MAAPPGSAHFQVTMPGLAGGPDELGLWQTAPPAAAPAPGGVPADGPPTVAVWRVDLPADRRLARSIVDDRAARLARAERALPDASRRLRTLVSQGVRQGGGPDAAGDLSFAAPLGPAPAGRVTPVPPTPAGTPERELLAWIHAASTAPASAPGAAGDLSFGLLDHVPLDWLPGDWGEVARQASDLFERVQQSLRLSTRVESTAGGRRLGLTTVAWSGHLRTAWAAGLGAEQVEQHARSLALALRTRILWLRMATLVARGGLQLGVLFPTSPFMAVPAAWRFFKQVIELSQELAQQMSAPAPSTPSTPSAPSTP